MNVVARKRQKEFRQIPAGLSVKEAATELGCSPHVAAKWGNKFGYSFRNGWRMADGRRRIAVFLDKVGKMPSGLTIREVAERLNVRYGYAQKLVAQAGYKFERAVGSGRSRMKVRRAQWPRLDWSQHDVVLAEQLGVSRERVRQVRMQLGMPKVTTPMRSPESRGSKITIKAGGKKYMAVDNALAKKALEDVALIEREAQQKRLAQLGSLASAKQAIMDRINELQHQLTQIDSTVETITGCSPAPNTRRERRDLTEVRERVGRWMEARRGQKFGAGDLAREFPELNGTAVSIFMKPLIHTGKVKTDASDGIRRTKYYVE